MKKLLMGLVFMGLTSAHAASNAPEGEYLIKLEGDLKTSQVRFQATLPIGSEVEDLGFNNWVKVKVPKTALKSVTLSSLKKQRIVKEAQPNYRIKLLENPNLAKLRAEIQARANDEDCPIPIPGFCDGNGGGGGGGIGATPKDNPDIPAVRKPGSGNDPLLTSQWGMLDIGTRDAWQKSTGRKDIVVAVIDTGVDYTHEDLVENLWRNPGEMGTDSQGRDKATNGVDDDNNGFVDDVIGWDFVSNDNKPFDLAVSVFELFTGGNPGHGTHCAGNVAARGMNGKGISGVAPHVSIMSIRFLSEKGQGTTDGAVKSIIYAIKNGAHVLSNSWGSEGEDPNDPDNQALREAIRFSEQYGRLFVAAAGNGHQGKGYDNDNDSKPAYPASYPDNIIISVAALDAQDQLGSFSNWGRVSVDIGAPGVKVFSTTVGGKYSDKVIDLFGMQINWDGTSMATPHVAGAAALYLSTYPNASWQKVKSAILNSAKPVSSMNGKSVSGGKLDVKRLLEM